MSQLLADNSLIDDLCAALKLKYIIKESESLEDFLGVHMARVNARLHLSQPGLIKKLITTAELQDNKRSVRIPIHNDWNEGEQDKTARCEGGIFRTLLGMLIFLLRTRPDIAFAVNTLATRCASATLRDLDVIHEVILYLKCTAHLGSSFPTTLLTLINVTLLVVSTVGRMLLTLVIAMASLTLACFSPTVYLALASSAVPARHSLLSALVRQSLSFMLLLKQPRISFSAELFLQNLVFTSGIPLRCMMATPALSHSRAS